MSDLLFDVPRNKARLEIAKETHGIETFRSSIDRKDKPWMAIVRPVIVKALEGYEDVSKMEFGQIFAGYCRLLDDWNLVGYGETEADAVLDVCRNCEIGVIL